MADLKALPKFERQYKKFYPKEQSVIKEELRKITVNPLLGEQKTGCFSYVQLRKSPNKRP